MTNNKVLLVLGLALLATFASYGFYNQHTNKNLTNAETDLLYSFPDINDLRMRVLTFKDWQKKYNKKYNDIELPIRFAIWNKNYEWVEDHNAKGLSWTVEMNMFADLTDEEFIGLHTGFIWNKAPKDNQGDLEMYDVAEDQDEFDDEEEDQDYYVEGDNKIYYDWRKAGAVNTIENQGQCGGCWAFSTAGALEGLYKIQKGDLLRFSKQQQIDCSSSYGNQGCNGGLMSNAFKYTKDKGIENEKDYPYEEKDAKCRYSSSKVVFKNKDHVDLPEGANQLRDALKKQPVSVAVQADENAFKLYQSGIVSSGCGANLDHAILAVAYGTTTSSGKKYWVVKNSWGTSWGEKGYIRIARGSQNGGKGICGINQVNSYPTL